MSEEGFVVAELGEGGASGVDVCGVLVVVVGGAVWMGCLMVVMVKVVGEAGEGGLRRALEGEVVEGWRGSLLGERGG